MIGGLIRRAIVNLVLFFFFGASAPMAAEAQSARPEIRAYRLTEAESIVVDGAPDEAAWQ